MINENILQEKLKYLLIMESKPKFIILDFLFMPEFHTNEKTSLESYVIDIKFDYDGPISHESLYFLQDIRKVINEIRELLLKYTITTDGKLISGTGNSWIDEGFIFDLNYKHEETHEFNMSFRISYED